MWNFCLRIRQCLQKKKGLGTDSTTTATTAASISIIKRAEATMVISSPTLIYEGTIGEFALQPLVPDTAKHLCCWSVPEKDSESGSSRCTSALLIFKLWAVLSEDDSPFLRRQRLRNKYSKRSKGKIWTQELLRFYSPLPMSLCFYIKLEWKSVSASNTFKSGLL